MSNLSTAVTSSCAQMAQVYKYPASAAPVHITESSAHHITLDELTATSVDDAKVRKSARLTGKVPGWKTFLQDEQHTPAAEVKLRRRKTGRTTSDEATEDEETTVAVQSIEMEDPEEVLKRQRVGKEDFPCEICGKSFTSEKYLSMHHALHGVQNPTEDLINGELRVEQEGYIKSGTSWICKICSKTFAQNSSFKNHMRTHSDERPYVCEVCSIGFKERYHLKKHQLFKHTTELKEECRFCKKRFKDSTAVRAHERIHSNARPYSCRNCKKAFKTSECLWHHENRSKACGKVAKTFPPTQRGRRGRKGRKPDEEEIDVKPTAMLNPSLAMHIQVPQVHQHDVLTPQAPVHVSQPQQHIKSEPLDLEDLDLVNQVIGFDGEDDEGPILNEEGELLIPTEAELPATSSELPCESSMVTTQSILVSPPQAVSTSPHITASVSITKPAAPVIPNQLTSQPPYSISVKQQLTSSTSMEAISHPVIRTSAPLVTPTICRPHTEVGAVNSVVPLPSVSEVLSRSTLQSHAQPVTRPIQAATSHVILGTPVTQPANLVEPVIVNMPVTQHYSHGAATSHARNQTSQEVSVATTCSSVQSLKKETNQHATAVVTVATVPAPENSIPKPSVEVTVVGMSQPINLPVPRPIPSAVPATKPVAAVQPWLATKKEVKEKPMQSLEPGEESMQTASWKPPVDAIRTKMSNFVCSKCNKGFAVKSAFQKHLERHEETEDKPYRCEMCKMGFKLKVHLKKHNLYRHSPEYPCKCSICGKRFKDSSAVRLHERIHSDIRPFFATVEKVSRQKKICGVIRNARPGRTTFAHWPKRPMCRA